MMQVRAQGWRALALASALVAAACSEDGPSPVGVDLLPGGILAGGIQSITLTEFVRAEDYEIFPSDRADSERLVTALDWPEDPAFESRALFEFSFEAFDSLSVDVEVVEAQLRLRYSPTPASPVTFTLHRVTADWEEEAATWERRLLGVPWTQEGGDFEPEPLATITIGPEQPDSVRIDFPLDLIEDWRSGAVENHGVILIQQTPGETVTFVSRADGTNRNGPLLDVELEFPGPGAVATILAIQDIFIVRDEAPLQSGDGLVVSGAEPVRRIFLDPAVDDIPAGVTIAAARLVVTIDEARVPVDSLTIVARQVLSEFVGEKTVLTSVVPAAVLGAAVVTSEAASGDTLSFESPALTRLVREWARDPDTRRGIALTLFDERSVFGGIRIFGPGAASSVRPRLRLLYVPPADPGFGQGGP